MFFLFIFYISLKFTMFLSCRRLFTWMVPRSAAPAQSHTKVGQLESNLAELQKWFTVPLHPSRNRKTEGLRTQFDRRGGVLPVLPRPAPGTLPLHRSRSFHRIRKRQRKGGVVLDRRWASKLNGNTDSIQAYQINNWFLMYCRCYRYTLMMLRVYDMNDWHHRDAVVISWRLPCQCCFLLQFIRFLFGEWYLPNLT